MPPSLAQPGSTLDKDRHALAALTCVVRIARITGIAEITRIVGHTLDSHRRRRRLGLGMAGAVVRAGSATKFWEKRAEMNRELRAEQQRLGLNGSANQKALYSQFPTPEITLCKPVVIAPGGSSPVALGGKFAEKTVFLAANDDVTLEGTLAAGKFTGTATAVADAGPGWAPVHAIAPVSGANRSCGAIFVGPVTPFEFKGDNGWTIKLTPQAKAFALSSEDATLPYAVTFFKDGEAKPFKTMATSMTFRQSDNPSRERACR